MLPGKRQRGFSLALVAVIILVMVAVFVAAKVFERTEMAAPRTQETQAKFARAHAALLSYVSANQRLPCPANPVLDSGLADPEVATITCNSPGGTLPWVTLGMSRNDGYDAWGWKISYRVFSGGVGSLTQAEGASMVKCECNLNAAGAVCEPTPAPPTAAGLCSSSTDPLTYATTESLFLAPPRLQVNDFGTIHTDAAYVLVSHGPSGLRAYTAAGVRRMDLTITSVAEFNNTADAGPFTAKAPSGGLSPDDPNFFDDVISYIAVANLIHNAGLGGRDWPDPP
jgi:type II secretory pathway pseudopilin PulG